MPGAKSSGWQQLTNECMKYFTQRPSFFARNRYKSEKNTQNCKVFYAPRSNRRAMASRCQPCVLARWMATSMASAASGGILAGFFDFFMGIKFRNNCVPASLRYKRRRAHLLTPNTGTGMPCETLSARPAGVLRKPVSRNYEFRIGQDEDANELHCFNPNADNQTQIEDSGKENQQGSSERRRRSGERARPRAWLAAPSRPTVGHGLAQAIPDV